MSDIRKWITRNFNIVRLIAAILIGVLFAVVLISLISNNPGEALVKFFVGPLQGKRRFGNVIELMIPLTLAGLSVTVMFSANQFNMSTEGSFFAGGSMAAICALTLGLPAGVSPLVSLLLGGLVGAVISVLPALFKVNWNTSELVSSLMLNFVVYYLFKYIMFSGTLKDPKAGYVATYKMDQSARFSKIVSGTRIHSGLIVMILLVILVAIFMKKTKWGFALKLTGKNSEFAAYAGIGVTSVILSSQMIGGMLAGIGGAVQVLGLYERFHWVSLPGFGFDGIIVAILAGSNPVFVPLAAFFLSYMRIGSDVMSSSSDVTNELISVIQSIIILFVSARVFLEGYRQKLIVKEAVKHE